MSRKIRFSLLSMLILASLLACNLVSQPLDNLKDTAATAQAIATSVQEIATVIPLSTLEALPDTLATAVPMSTLEALPDSLATSIPGAGEVFNPTGKPLTEWKGIPVMPGATAGDEFEGTTYSFKINATYEEISKYYNDTLPGLGWQSTFGMPGDTQSVFMLFSKGTSTLTITAMPATDNAGVVVMLLLVP